MEDSSRIFGPAFDSTGLLAGRYKIVTELGRGGMGAVFKALDTELHNTPVALKLIHTGLAADDVVFERFRNEVLIARSLTHPNIVRTYDLGRAADGYYFISMEYVEGKTLASWLSERQGTPFSAEETLRILKEILQAVDYAHRHDIVHRDLKPSNVLLTQKHEVKLVDFGTARLLGAEGLTRTGEMIGTPAYMAPEQIAGASVDARTDLYAIGILAFELLTGRRPFSGENVMALMASQVNEPLPNIARKDISAALKRAVAKASAKRKEDRFQSAAEFLAALEEKSAPGSANRKNAAMLLLTTLLLLVPVLVLLFAALRQQDASQKVVFKEPEATSSQTSLANDASTKKKEPSTVSVQTSLPTQNSEGVSNQPAPTNDVSLEAKAPTAPPQSSLIPDAEKDTSRKDTIAPPVPPVTVPVEQSRAALQERESSAENTGRSDRREAEIIFRLPSSAAAKTVFIPEELSDVRIIARLKLSPEKEKSCRMAIRSLETGREILAVPLHVLAAGEKELQLRGSFREALSNKANLPVGRYQAVVLKSGRAIAAQEFEIVAR